MPYNTKTKPQKGMHKKTSKRKYSKKSAPEFQLCLSYIIEIIGNFEPFSQESIFQSIFILCLWLLQ